MIKKTKTIRKADIRPDWFLIDATGVRLGRLASFVATILQGKNKALYMPNIDCGDYVVIINSKNVDVHKSRWDKKYYRHHTGYPGGLKTVPFKEMMEKDPTRVIRKAVWGMMPKTKLGRVMLKKLFTYADGEHKHKANKPKLIEIK